MAHIDYFFSTLSPYCYLAGTGLAWGDFAVAAAEVAWEGSRLDFRLAGRDGQADCLLEVKNVTAAVRDGVAIFPDAVSERATRHLGHLVSAVAQGLRAAMCFCVQRGDVEVERVGAGVLVGGDTGWHRLEVGRGRRKRLGIFAQ